MARSTPNINIDTTQKLRDRLGFKEFVLQVNTDTFIYNYIPSTIELNEDGRLITLTLINKKFIFDILELDDVSDYVDVYLFGVKQPQDRYNAEVVGNNIIVTFVADITRLPNEVNAANFEIKGKIAEIV
jgi:hypothetical protein